MIKIKRRLVIVIGIVFGLLLTGIVMIISRPPAHDPKDLRYWICAAGEKDWSSEAAQSRPEAEFFHGASFIRSNFVVDCIDL